MGGNAFSTRYLPFIVLRNRMGVPGQLKTAPCLGLCLRLARMRCSCGGNALSTRHLPFIVLRNSMGVPGQLKTAPCLGLCLQLRMRRSCGRKCAFNLGISPLSCSGTGWRLQSGLVGSRHFGRNSHMVVRLKVTAIGTQTQFRIPHSAFRIPHLTSAISILNLAKKAPASANPEGSAGAGADDSFRIPNWFTKLIKNFE